MGTGRREVAAGRFDMVACIQAPPPAFVVPDRCGIVRLSLSSTRSDSAWLSLAFQADPLVAYRKMAALCFSPNLIPRKGAVAPVHAGITSAADSRTAIDITGRPTPSI